MSVRSVIRTCRKSRASRRAGLFILSRWTFRQMEDARRWLAEDRVRQVGNDEWTDGEAPDDRLTANEVAHNWSGLAFTDERLDAAEQLRLALGLLDLLDDYWVTCEILFACQGPDGPLPAEVLWDGSRRRLEAPQVSETVTYSLWVDWFEGRSTSATAFAEVLDHDIEQLTTDAPDAALAMLAELGLPADTRAPRRATHRTHRRAQQPLPKPACVGQRATDSAVGVPMTSAWLVPLACCCADCCSASRRGASAAEWARQGSGTRRETTRTQHQRTPGRSGAGPGRATKGRSRR